MGMEQAASAFTGDWTPEKLNSIIQPQKQFSREDDETWGILYRNLYATLKSRACSVFLDSLPTLHITESRVPRLSDVSAALKKLTGWQVVSVPGLLLEEPLFELMASRRWPVGNFMRPRDQLEFTAAPDIFHDLFGHVPVLADPVFADFMAAYGQLGLKAARLGLSKKLSRLWWYTIEFGLIREKDGPRIYGGGLMTLPSQAAAGLDSNPPRRRLRFSLERVLQTRYDDESLPKQNYFVVDDFRHLYDEVFARDFAAVHAALEGKPEFAPGDISGADTVLQ